MKINLIFMICVLFVASCVKLQDSKYLWPVQSRAKIVAKINKEINTFNLKMKNKHKDKFNLKLPSNVRDVLVSPNGMKLKFTFNDNQTKVYSQNDFDFTFSIYLEASYSDDPKKSIIRGPDVDDIEIKATVGGIEHSYVILSHNNIN